MSCSTNTCTAQNEGTWTVTGSYGALQAQATLTVVPATQPPPLPSGFGARGIPAFAFRISIFITVLHPPTC